MGKSPAGSGQERLESYFGQEAYNPNLFRNFNHHWPIYFMEQENLKNAALAILFTSGRPLKLKDLAKILEADASALKTALEKASDELKESGIILLENGGEYQLATNSKYSTQVKNFLNAELREKLTDATVEVLAIIAYRQPISKAEIEAIRGVNSQYSIRNLLMRGLIEKVTNPNDARSFLYQTTTEFLMHMGLASAKDLPEFEKLVEKIKLPQTPGLQQQETPSETAPVEPPAENNEPAAQASQNEGQEEKDDEYDDEEEDGDEEDGE